MTDPRMDPAGTQGPDGGTNPPAAGSQQPAPQGGMPAGSRENEPGGKTSTGAGSPGSDMSGTQGTSRSAATTAGTATATRSSAGPSVPQQSGQAPSARSAQGEQAYSEEYGAGTRGYPEPGMNMVAKAAEKSWMALLLGGLAMIAVGIMLLVWPHASLTIVAILIGAALVASGLVKLWEGFTAHGESGGTRTAYVVIGLLAVLAGLYCLRHHAVSLFAVAFVTGIYFIMHGIADLGVAASAAIPGRALRAVLGIFSIVAGILMVVWPGITVVLLLTLVAAWLIFYGCLLGALAFGLRRAVRTESRSAAPTTTTAMPAQAA